MKRRNQTKIASFHNKFSNDSLNSIILLSLLKNGNPQIKYSLSSTNLVIGIAFCFKDSNKSSFHLSSCNN